MNRTQYSVSLALGAATFCLFAASPTASLHAQQPTHPRSRPAARPKPGTPAPAATPNATPPPLNAPPEKEPGDSTPPTDDADAAKGQETETVIDAAQSATFNSKDRVAVFTKDVRVKDPRFELACDKLTVFLNKSASPDASAPATAATPPPLKSATPPAPGQQPSPAPAGGGIDHALAEGHVIIIQRKAATKPGEEDKLSIGRGGIGTFDNKTGDMVLKDWPNLEQNGSSLIAKAQSTVMTIHRDSSMDCEGPNTTRLIQHGKGGTLDIPMAPTAPSTNRRGNGNPAAAPAATPAASPARGARPAATPH